MGKVYPESSFAESDLIINYNTGLNDSIYAVEAPDALYPFDGSETILRYSENNFGAGIGYKKDYGVIISGFPFETVLGEKSRVELMNLVLKFLLR